MIVACVTIGVAVGAGVWIYKRWKQDNEKGSFEDEVRLLNRKNKNRQTKNSISILLAPTLVVRKQKTTFKNVKIKRRNYKGQKSFMIYLSSTCIIKT